MKTLLLAIKARLQSDSTLGYIRDTDIFITENESLIPDCIKFPAIGIKDGSERNTQKLTKNYIQDQQVKIIVYQQVLKSGESITGTHGVLDMASDVITSLIDNKLSISGIQNVFPTSSDPSELVGDEQEMIQRKTITFTYTRLRNWT